jgi:hypothetical protein
MKKVFQIGIVCLVKIRIYSKFRKWAFLLSTPVYERFGNAAKKSGAMTRNSIEQSNNATESSDQWPQIPFAVLLPLALQFFTAPLIFLADSHD